MREYVRSRRRISAAWRRTKRLHDRHWARPWRGLVDRLVRSVQARFAAARGRNPPMPPRHKREIRSWQTLSPARGPSEPSARTRPLILGLTAVWNEDDIVWATVRNLLAQGVDDVFVLDDGSSDGTCDEARAAGATVVRKESDGVYCEDRRAERIRQFVDAHTGILGGDVWWIVVDADEFPRGPDGLTIRELVGDLPAWVDIVGSRVLEHLPGPGTNFQSRIHPAHSLPLARWYNSPYCPQGHWKHQLFRARTPGDVYPLRGCHTLGTGDGRRAREATPTLLMHHVPLRDRVRTAEKLRSASASGGRYTTEITGEFTVDRLRYRLRILDQLYNGQFSDVPNTFAGEPAHGITLCDWRELVPEAEHSLPAFDDAARNPDPVATARWFAEWGPRARLRTAGEH